jgi:purine nucleosidase
MLADAVCRAAGREDVPIHAGYAEPLVIEQRQPEAPQAEVLSRWPHRDDFASDTAVEFLRRTIRSRPGEITLLTIGPLTNAGMLFSLDHDTAGMLKRVAMMGGCYFEPDRSEWNTSGDPTASELVFAADLPELVAYGLDVTLQCTMPAEECRRRLRGGPLDVVADMAEVWFRKRDRITFHDPLAGLCVFEPGVCSYRRGRIRMALDRAYADGATVFEEKEGGPHRVADEVNAARFFERYFQVTGEGGAS